MMAGVVPGTHKSVVQARLSCHHLLRIQAETCNGFLRRNDKAKRDPVHG